MPNLRLLHLTFAGIGRDPARVVFDPKLTVIYGASDTGKSFVTEAIDYMLGARKLSMIPEAEGYTQILLGLQLPDSSVITLMRGPQSGKVSVYNADLRELIYRAADLELTAQHSAKSSKNLSRYLLEQIGLDGSLISTNDTGGSKLLGFRDLLHLCLISETRMVSKVSPVLRATGTSGQSAHKSVLKLLLTGEGEPPADDRPSPGQRRVHKGKISLLDELILDLQRQLDPNGGNEAELAGQLHRVLTHQDEAALSLRDITGQHARAVARRAELSVTLGQYEQRLGEVDDLLGRFGLLRNQYESDLARLEMVNEAGSLLGYFRTGPCVFCGAEPEHQSANHDSQETTALHTAVHAESTKTRQLLSDLRLTIDDLRVQREELIGKRTVHVGRAQETDRSIAHIEDDMQPLQNEAAELMTVRSLVEAQLGLHRRIQELEDVRAGLVADGAVPGGRPSTSVPAGIVAEFDRAVERTLEQWQVRLHDVSYDQYSAELFVGDHSRAGHGKGMRAVLHAAFAVSLAEYCLAKEHRHPGFVVLDSPLVTYRQPGIRRTDDPDLPDSVIDYFYRDLFSRFAGQAVVVENGDPPADIVEQAHVYMFSRDPHDHRFGFFPVLPDTVGDEDSSVGR
ncbi:hypothetical protein [Streptomyces sp. AM8-1-1]|uniref:hypothetical protein n=1 Tax=Streptomyces sp. AM8-1-1 TaxID=3075825 RepID=UPI0028C406DA|nr:hypothetical protein [Streptomyces sp. AM8-1-1]WNO70137.1 hypothetical protein RPQ07_00110 [Streptomyces sp. AM8-1-1]WNO77419.1 hypothetical protein RPQ07_37615 [Streptomyces sp. AM8-1-1]